MSNSRNDPALKVTVKDLAQALRDARDQGRPIVPIVGAGLSADSGFPVVTSVVRYFGKLQQYIKHRAYLPPLGDNDPLVKRAALYQSQPWLYVEDFGWPDRFQLNQDLFTRLQDLQEKGQLPGATGTCDRLVEWAVQVGLNELLPGVNQQGFDRYGGLRGDIVGLLRGGLGSDLKEELSPSLAEQASQNHLHQCLERLCASVNDRFDRYGSKSAAFEVVGDWRRLILYFTNFQGDYADALFARLGAGRQPAQGHRFLAFLVRLLGVRSIFTFNFDRLIEQALEGEGVHPIVFAMERGAGLPHHSLVRDQVSVIKMHGSTHALLLDEQLDRPLTEEYTRRFDRITGPEPLLLVVGCSADDNRLRDLVKHVLHQADDRKRAGPSVLWLHYEDAPPDFLGKAPGAAGRVRARQTNNPGATLLHLHSWLTSQNPAGRSPYLAHVQQPFHLGALPEDDKKWAEQFGTEKFTLLSSGPGVPDNQTPAGGQVETFPDRSASQMLLVLANYWARKGYHFVWIDLEALHTLAGVVGSIIDQCRKYDTGLAPSVLPADQDVPGPTLASAAKRVARALRGTRYFLAFDGLETYVWPATAHHGLTHTGVAGAAQRLKELCGFLATLAMEDLGESRIGVSVDDPKSRHNDARLGRHVPFEEQVKQLQTLHSKLVRVGDAPCRFDAVFHAVLPPEAYSFPLVSLKSRPPGVPAGKEGPSRLALVLFILSCFRRTRPLVALRQMLGPLLGVEKNNVDGVLAALSDPANGFGLIRPLEGGGYWFNRTVRDYVYETNTQYTSTDHLRQCLTSKRKEDWSNAGRQLFLSAIIHQQIARTWYTKTFVQSQDTFAFLEYTYHRLSSLRYLGKLLALTRTALQEGSDPALSGAILNAIHQCGKLMEMAVDPKQSLARFDFEAGDGRVVFELLTKEPAAPRAAGRSELLEATQKELQDRHHRELRSLYRAWVRSEMTLRGQVPAEQLLHWCRVLLNDDLEYRCNKVVIDYDGTPPAYGPKTHSFMDSNQSDLVNPLADKAVRSFKRYLQDLQVKLWVERSDYDTCIHERWRQLCRTDRAKPPTTRDLKTFVSEHDVDVVQCHQLLDIADCLLKRGQELIADDDLLRQDCDETETLLTQLAARLRGLRHATPEGDLHEARLRLLHLRAECQLGRVSVFSHDGFTGNASTLPQVMKADEATVTVSSGLLQIRTQDPRTYQPLRSVVIDPTTDGALYLQYRSVFHLLSGRARWLTGKLSEKAFEDAFRDFDMARGGLGDHNCLASALVELYAVEACLAQARAALHPAGDTADPFGRARAKYESARGALQRAREALLSTRRNAIWWKFFFHLTTQYHADRLLLDYAQLYCDLPDFLKCRPAALPVDSGRLAKETSEAVRRGGEMLQEFLKRLRRAYKSLHTALDYHLLPSKSAPPLRWLHRLWWELTLCGYATGRVAIQMFAPERDAGAVARHIVRQLLWLNHSAGLGDCSQLQIALAMLNNPEAATHLTALLAQHSRKAVVDSAQSHRLKVVELATRISTLTTGNQQAIEKKAHEKWQQGGCKHGNDKQDWYSAELELAEQIFTRLLALGKADLEDPSPASPNPAVVPA